MQIHARMVQHGLRLTLLSLMALLSFTTLKANANQDDMQQAWDNIAAGALVVDVRTPEEFAAGHLPNAINIPHEQVVTELTKRNIAKNSPMVLYCRSGRRSAIAIEALSAVGFNHLYNGGGYEQLIQAAPVKPQ